MAVARDDAVLDLHPFCTVESNAVDAGDSTAIEQTAAAGREWLDKNRPIKEMKP